MSRMQAWWRMILVHAHHSQFRHPEVTRAQEHAAAQDDGTRGSSMRREQLRRSSRLARGDDLVGGAAGDLGHMIELEAEAADAGGG
jgi:hypothetical protein